MATYDVFNGDADGICALAQLRNAEPQSSVLVTGVKRDIKLLQQVTVESGDRVTVLDISLDKNRDALQHVLDNGADVFYVDHHFAGDIPTSERLTAIINTAADVCTSLLVNRHLQGRFVEWAVTGAFGDNLKRSAEVLAKPLSLSQAQLSCLESLGIYINYNSYGGTVDDLHFSPVDLYRTVSRYATPFEFISDAGEMFEKLESGYHTDMKYAADVQAEFANDAVAAYILPDKAWARRVSGVYSNNLANQAPERAHAVLTKKSNGHFVVSVRAPLANKTGADQLCREFATGGGRAAAAGINDLPAADFDAFIDRFSEFYRD